MIMSNVGTLGVSIGPLLQTRFTMAELLTTHAAGSAFAFMCSLLSADSPQAASAPDLSTRCGTVVNKVCIGLSEVSLFAGTEPAFPLRVASCRSQVAGTGPALT